jgi:hypothetical protein
MVEVFKTNVTSTHQARALVNEIQYHFRDYKVNFDLDDCDHILRIESLGIIEPHPVIAFLKNTGVYAEVLTDEPVLLIIS